MGQPVTLPASGGWLFRGPPPTADYKAGPGRPTTEIRREARESFSDRLRNVRAIADGVPIVRTSILLGAVLPFVECATCREASVVQAKTGIDAASIEIEALGSAKPTEMLQALRILADIGVGPDRQLSVEAIRERIQQMLETLRKELPEDTYTRVVPQLRQIWTTTA